jgi:hypothetical protein
VTIARASARETRPESSLSPLGSWMNRSTTREKEERRRGPPSRAAATRVWASSETNEEDDEERGVFARFRAAAR